MKPGAKKLGNLFCFLRLTHSYKQDYVALLAGYENKRTYAKIEQGEIINIKLDRLILISKVFSCKPYQLMFLSELPVFSSKIKTWDEFINSMKYNSQDMNVKIIEIIRESFPKYYNLYKADLLAYTTKE